MSFGGTIKLTGESEYRRALKNIQIGLKEVASQTALTAAKYDSSDKSVANLTQKQKELTNAYDKQKKLVADLKNNYSSFSTKVKEQEKAHEELTKEYNTEKAKLEQIGKTLGTTSKEYQDQEKKVEELEEATIKSRQANDQNKNALSKMGTALNKAEKDLIKTEKAMDEVGDSTEESAEKVEMAKEGFTVFKGVLSNLATKVITSAVRALKDLSKESFEAGADFEAAMSQVEAVSGATGDELKSLTDKASEMGAKTKFSATQSAEAFNYMAMAGWKTEDMLDGIEGVMNLAAASGEDLATTSDIVTDALTAMGYSAKDAGKLADVMAAASSNANTNVGMMGQTFQYAAPIVGSLGYSMEDTAIQIGLMANAGIKGTKAGTSLRAMLSRLAAPPKSCAAAMEELGLSLTDSNGRMKSLDEVMGELRVAFSQMSETQKTATARNLAGQSAMSGLLAIVNAAPADYAKLKKAVTQSSGAAQKMSDTMNNNVKGAMTIFKSQVEGIQISIFKKLVPSFRKAISSASDFLKKVNWNKFGKEVESAFGKAIKGLTWIVKHHKLITNGVKLMIGAFATAKMLEFTKSLSLTAKKIIAVALAEKVSTTATNADTASTVTNTVAKNAATVATKVLAAAQKLLNAAWASNPIGGVITGLIALASVVTLVATGISKLTNKHKELTEEEKAYQAQLKDSKKELDEHKKALKESADAWDELSKAQQQSIDVGMSELVHLETLYEELQDIVDENGKVKRGYKERADFIIGQMNDAFGLELQNVKGVIKGYKKLTSSIDSLLEKKRAKIILDALEEKYKEALTNEAQGLQDVLTAREQLTEAEKNALDARKNLEMSDPTRVEAETLYANARDNLIKAEETYSGYVDAIGQYENNMALYHKKKYGEMKIDTWSYVSSYGEATDEEKKILEDNVTTAQARVNELVALREQGNKNITDNQIKEAKKQLKNAKDNLNQFVDNQKKANKEEEKAVKEGAKKVENATKDGTKKAEAVWSKSLRDQVSKITGSKVKFKEAGLGLVQMYVNGEKSGAPLPKQEMAKITQNAINEVKKKKAPAKKAGEDLIEGINNGIKNRNKQNSVFGSISLFGNSLLKKLKTSLKEKSPSKATDEMGQFLIQGLGIGISKETGAVYNQVTNFSKGLLKRFDLENAVTDKFTAPINTAIKSMPDLSLKDFNNQRIERAIKISLNNDRPNDENKMVSAFKKALSEMKIELDDQVAGKFVEKTVSKAIYNY
jgi:TP901 family phage tail tape measure protein